MGTVTTEYAVNLRYQMQNQAVLSGARAMGGALQQAHTQSQAFGMSLGRIGAMLAGGVGLYQAKKSLIDFNSGMEQAQITMAGMMAQAGKGDFVGNMKEASELVKQMQLDARASVGTTEDFVQMATSIVQPLMMAKGSMQDLRDMTRQTVIASRSMGIGADVASRDVGQALMGRYNTVDPFLSRILPAIGYAGEEGRAKWRTLKESERLSELRRALGSKGIMDMGKAQETSFSGAASTLKDNIQMTLGKVGMPLFKAVTEELNKWNKWLDNNQGKIHQMAKEIGGDLLSGAKMFLSASKFAAEHWKQLLGTALALKSAGVLASFGGAAGAAGAARAAAGAGALPFAGKMAAVTLVASAVYIGATAIADWINDRQTQDLNRQSVVGDATMVAVNRAIEKSGLAETEAQRAEQGRILRQLMASVGGEGSYKTFLTERLNRMTQAERNAYEASAGLKPWKGGMGTDYESSIIHHSAESIADAFMKRINYLTPSDWIAKGGMMQDVEKAWRMPGFVDMPKAPKLQQNITIHRIEVASDDPDRMAIGFTDWLANIARNPANAKHALREAG